MLAGEERSPMNGKMGLFKEGPYYKGDILLGVPKKILDVHRVSSLER